VSEPQKYYVEDRRQHTNDGMIMRFNLRPLIHKFDDVFIYSGLSAE